MGLWVGAVALVFRYTNAPTHIELQSQFRTTVPPGRPGGGVVGNTEVGSGRMLAVFVFDSRTNLCIR